jgi:methylenetetrahydrofolate dehydrogenase (NADP+) / methenyltetrahydrofolate cyclohydrolase
MKIDGKAIAAAMYESLRKRVGELQKKNIIPHLVVILIEEDPASVAYVRQKQKQGEAIGAKVTVLHYDRNITNEELEEKIKELNADPTVHAMLLQRPVPAHIDVGKLELLVDPQKDIDGFHPDSPYTLPLPLAVVRILEEVHYSSSEGAKATESRSKNNVIPDSDWGSMDSRPPIRVESMFRGNNKSKNFLSWLQSQHIVVIGKGPTGGGPVIAYLKKLGITPEIVDSKTQNPEKIIKQADIVISSVGKEEVVKPEMLKKGVILISVGLFRGSDGKLHGDYDEEKIQDVASFYTPTPGGVGPVNVAMLIENLLRTAEEQSEK